VRAAVLAFVFVLLATPQVFAQAPPVCHVLCTPKLKVEPTVTFTNLLGSPRIVGEQGTTTRERRETEFEVSISVGLPTRAPWLEFTVEAIFLPFDRESTPEMESRPTSSGCVQSKRAGGSALTSTSSTSSVPASGRPTAARTHTN
jgi:hypothetical protein